MVSERILQEYDERRDAYQALVTALHSVLTQLLIKEGVKHQGIYPRVKSRGSLIEKLERKSKYTSLADITDIAGVRIITYFEDDINQVMKIIENELAIDTTNTVDKRQPEQSDRFGYKSMQYVAGFSYDRLRLPEYALFAGLKFEIQIRTVLQHAWSEVDHLYRYKNKADITPAIHRKFSRLAAQLEDIDNSFIELRNLLDKHAEDLLSRVQKGNPEVFNEATEVKIDNDVIPIIYTNSPLVKEFDVYMAGITDSFYKKESVHELMGQNYEFVIWRLNFVGLYTAADIANAFETHRETFKRWLKLQLSPKGTWVDGVGSGHSLIQLIYFLAAREGAEKHYELNAVSNGRVFDRFKIELDAKTAWKHYVEAEDEKSR